ncbi:ABC transporter permease [Mesomycoplasma molare]|uniref:ABC transporter permease n=1 Tax=Mesomycoplasma molare TaxID=171288 RepID=A0ABY5TXA7_9BACT|nr:ABC transporter permease [Mesomycoplasma molare]UWD34161.1 ABC transporter permease [Mesomycoplasma molare]
MFKLLKEIFKSLSKNKITTVSLSILIFLTTGVFTLLFSVKESFNREINKYNIVSKLHDSTVDLDINFSANAKDNGYKKLEVETFKPLNTNNEEEVEFKINEKFIKLDSLGVKNNFSNYYISANDLKKEYDINKNISNIDNKEFNFDLNNNSFSIQKENSKVFFIYEKENENYKIKESKITLSKNSSVSLDKIYSLKEIINIASTGEEGGFFSGGKNHSISSINRMGVNVQTKEATFDISKINFWENIGVLYLLTENETANLVGLENVNSNFQLKGRSSFSSELFNWDNIAKWASTFSSNIVLKPEGTTNSSLRISNIRINEDKIIKIKEIFTFSHGINYTLNPDWISRNSYEIKYILNKFELHDLDSKEIPFSSSFLYYLKTLKEKSPEEFNKIKNLRYWEKEIINKKNNKNSFTIKQKLNKDDLVTTIYNEKDLQKKQTTIKDIENLGNENNLKSLTSEQLASLSNNEIVDLNYLRLKNSVSNNAKNTIFDYVKNDERVFGLGRRRSITTSSINDKNGENYTFHFVDAGINNDFFDEERKQEVGKLYNESLEKSHLFLQPDTKINKHEVDSIYEIEIINAIFQGFIPESSHISPTIEFINVQQGLTSNSKAKEKVVILVPKDNSENKIYSITKKTNGYVIYKKNSDDNWIKIIFKGKNEFLLQEIYDFMNIFNLKIKSDISKNGWFKVNENFSNTYYVPFIYRAPSSELLKEIETNKTVKTLFNSLFKSIINSDLVKENYIKVNELEKLFIAMQESFSNTEYYEIFTNGKNDQSLMQRMIFESLYLVTIQNQDTFLNDVINNFIEQIQNKIRNHGNSLEQQKDYLFEEIDKLGIVLDNAGINIWSNISQLSSKEDIKAFINDPIEFLEGIKNIISSVNFKAFLTEIHDWYENKWNKQETNGQNAFYYFGISDLVVPLIKSVDFEIFKIGINKIIDNIDFDILLSTKYNESEHKYKGIIFNELINNYKESVLKEQITNSLIDIFNKLNSNKDQNLAQNNFKNINNGLKQIINILDKNKLLSLIEENLENTYFEDKKTFKNSNSPEKVLFVTKSLKTSNLILAFLDSYFKDNNSSSSLLNAVETLLNLSGKTKSQGALGITYSVPEADNEKVDLFSLQNLELLSYAKLESIINTSNHLNAKLESKEQLNSKDQEFIKTYLLIKNEALDNKEEIISRNNLFLEIIDLFLIKKYKKTNTGIEINKEFNSVSDSPSIADYLHDIYSERATGNTALRRAKNEAKQVVSKVVNSSEYSASVNSLVFYNFWIKFIIENNHLSKEEIKNAFVQFEQLARNRFSNLYADLNNEKLYDNKDNYVQKFIAFGNDIEPIGRGIVNPFMSAETIFSNDKNNTNQELKSIINPEVDNEISLIFKKINPKNNLSLSEWILKNKTEFISNLSQITHMRKFHRDSSYFHSLNSTFDILNDFTHSKDNINLEMINSLRKEFTTQSSAFLALGLSDTVASTYSGVIFPTVAAWFTANPTAGTGDYGNANLSFILKNRVIDFHKLKENNSEVYKEKIKEIINLFSKNDYSETVFEYRLENHEVKGLSLDLAYVNYIDKNILKTTEQNEFTFFDININKLFYDLIDASTTIREENKFLVFKDIRSLVAKVNKSFLIENKKEAYKETLPSDFLSLEKLIESLDEKYVLNVNGSKFLIVGDDNTIDYLFPVLDEENIQVNTKNQALIYVNKWGFDRIRESFRGNALKDYLLVKLENIKEQYSFNQDIEKYIQNNFSNSSLKKVYNFNELDIVNPERSLRISTGFSLINLITQANFYMVTLMFVLISISTIFITKRYISTRNKVIGILRAQGYKSSMIAFSFISFPLLTSIIGGVIGYTLGLLLQIPLKNVFSSYWTLPTNNIYFEWIPFVLTIIVPFIALSILVVLSALWTLRKKPIELMSGIAEINISRLAHFLSKGYKKWNIQNKFIASLSINSFWKLLSLVISTVLTAFISIFSIASNGVFKNSVDTTYENRNYNYKLDLETPTTQSGQYKTFNKDDLYNLLYVPLGEASESNIESNNYFLPGRSLVNGSGDKNGNPQNNDPHVLTRAALQLQVESSISISPWDIVLNSMPDSQKARTLKVSKEAILKLEKTQNIQTVEKINKLNEKYIFEFVGTLEKPLNYFKFIEDENISSGGKFWYMVWNSENNEYSREAITTNKYRDEYRNFLVEGYKKIDINDFYIAFGGVPFNNDTNEKFTYVQTSYQNDSNLKIYGYDPKSKFVKINDSKGNNLLEIIDKYNKNGTIKPLAANHVFLRKNNLKLGDEIELEIKNPTDRFIRKIENKSWDKDKFKIVAIINTFINSELATTKDIANNLIGLDKLSNDGFNGILSVDQIPEQTIASIGLFSNSGYWFGGDSIVVETKEQYENYFSQIFSTGGSQLGALKNSGLSDELIKKVLVYKGSLIDNLENLDLSYENITSDQFKNNNTSLIKQGVNNFIELYSKNIYSSVSTSVDAKNIEIGFVNQISDTISKLTLSVVIIFFNVSIVILIMISNMIIAENERNIAIFSILGYSNKEKIKLFFGIYVPLLFISTLIAIPIVIGFIALFNAFLISSSSIVLVLSLQWTHVLISIFALAIVYTLTSLIAWLNLNKIKAIYLLKGK